MHEEPNIRKISKNEMSKDEFLLYECMRLLRNTDEFYAFFKDLCTPQEIKVMAERWSIAIQLGLGEKSYREIQEASGAGMSTISRVGRFLKDEGYKGYQLVLSRIRKDFSSRKQ